MSCSVLVPSRQTVTVTSSEPDAIVSINGIPHKPPVTYKAKRNQSLLIVAEKPGFNEYRQSIDYHMNATGILDTLGTIVILLPAVGLMTPGAFSLDETNIAITMVPIAK
ncbi:MAG TPA: hypothetical protein VFR01_09265 [Geobacterales bacterium]|nr:hypothetical protein [Geobacterales bacterium]